MTETAESESLVASNPGAIKRASSQDPFHHIEQAVYIAVGAMLTISALIGLAGAAALLWHGMLDWTGTGAVFETIDRLLFVLMLVEILHTVSVSVRTGTLVAQPFLVVGLIATIRRILMITLETSETMRGHQWSDQVQSQLYASLAELGVLGLLIVAMVASMTILHRQERRQRVAVR